MALFAQNMLQIAIILVRDDPTYVDMVTKFAEHYLRIAGALEKIGPNGEGLWDEQDGFFTT